MQRQRHILRARDKTLYLGERTQIMGILNVTPDSFSDGGRFIGVEEAVDYGLRLLDEGADILDIGGESSRPGAEPISPQEEIDRVIPVIEKLRPLTPAILSLDTWKSKVAREALRLGVDVINDIGALRLDPAVGTAVAENEAAVVLMHMRGTPPTMQQLPPSPDIMSDIVFFLREAVERAEEQQIPRDRMILDPGIGFGKTVQDNLRILNQLRLLEELDLPILVGTSRKSFLGRLLAPGIEERIWGTAASVAVSILRGAHIVRVHDVKEMKMVVTVVDSITTESTDEA